MAGGMILFLHRNNCGTFFELSNEFFEHFWFLGQKLNCDCIFLPWKQFQYFVSCFCMLLECVCDPLLNQITYTV